MALKALAQNRWFSSLIGAALSICSGLLLWAMPAGDWWANKSYDYLFRFGARSPTNQVVIIFMDNDAYDFFGQKRGEPWDRSIHAELLNKLADDGCPLVVFDILFSDQFASPADETLVKAMRRQRAIALMAKLADPTIESQGAKHYSLDAVHPTLPASNFVEAARGNWGVAYFDSDADSIVRRLWPYPAGHIDIPSLSAKAAELYGAHWQGDPEWLRYYYYREGSPAWTSLSYKFATNTTPGYFRDKIVFVGNKPATSSPFDHEIDEFSTPFSHWQRPLKSVGGVELHATAFLNLINNEWLRGFPVPLQVAVLLVCGGVFGAIFPLLRPLPALSYAFAGSAIVSLGAVCLSYYTNYWFPWLIPAAIQIPCALAVSLISARVKFERSRTLTLAATLATLEERPETPDYQLLDVAFGEGAYGKVWLAKNAVGQWQALKTVYRARFRSGPAPYDREFNGIRRYKPISDMHPGLLRVEFVSSKKEEGYFYYVMELGDSLVTGWEKDPATYRPADLAAIRAQFPDLRLPFAECLRIAQSLCEALEFLHDQRLTHRDIKPRNILMVKGQPKLADVGLVTDIRPGDAEMTLVGTPGYMPPPPEPPGTVQADIFGLGMVLYVILSGKEPENFPEVGATLVENTPREEFILFNSVILKACQPAREKRYASVTEMRLDLEKIKQSLRSMAPSTRGSPEVGL